MAQSKNLQVRLQNLIGTAKQMNIEVRTEKLLRDVGYRVRSGRCRVNRREIILIDRDAPIGDQIDFLAAELAKGQSKHTQPEVPPGISAEQ